MRYNLPELLWPADGERVNEKRTWVARLLVAGVLFVNVQCAAQFIIWPDAYVAAYQLEGASAKAIVRSFGICFLMWNATYPPVVAQPERHRVLFGVAIAQQAIGLVGETLLFLTLEPGLETLASSILRFIAFDATGLILLVIAFIITRETQTTKSQPATSK